MTTQVSTGQVDALAVVEHVCKSARLDFGRRLCDASPGVIEGVLARDPRFWKAFDRKFAQFVMHSETASSDLLALNQHPVGAELIARAMYTKGYDDDHVGVEGASDRTRELMMVAARSSSPRQSGVNVCPFIPPPDRVFEDRKTLRSFSLG